MIDESTGLPELPEGYFWRVRLGTMSITRLELRKNTWYGSKKVDSRVLHYYDDARNVLNPANEIARGALAILKEFSDPWPEYYGDYPPRKLETS